MRFVYFEILDLDTDLRATFNMFDLRGKGVITCDELKKAMRSLGQKPTDAEVRDVMRSVGKSEDDVITFEDFVRLIDPPSQRELKKRRSKSGASQAEMREAFKSEISRPLLVPALQHSTSKASNLVRSRFDR